MRTTTMISKGGQISVPADVRRRWATSRLSVEDRGDELILRPIPLDPIGAALGSLKTGPMSSDEMRRLVREEDAERDTGPL